MAGTQPAAPSTRGFLWEEGFIWAHVFRGWNASRWGVSWWAAETCDQNCSQPGGSGSREEGLAELLWVSHLIFLSCQGLQPMCAAYIQGGFSLLGSTALEIPFEILFQMTSNLIRLRMKINRHTVVHPEAIFLGSPSQQRKLSSPEGISGPQGSKPASERLLWSFQLEGAE